MKRLISVSVGLAMMLLASQAYAFAISGAVASRVSGPGRAGVAAGSISGINVDGAVTIHGITVLPNGQMIVPAITPRVRGGAVAPRSGNVPMPALQPVRPCLYSNCTP